MLSCSSSSKFCFEISQRLFRHQTFGIYVLNSKGPKMQGEISKLCNVHPRCDDLGQNDNERNNFRSMFILLLLSCFRTYCVNLKRCIQDMSYRGLWSNYDCDKRIFAGFCHTDRKQRSHGRHGRIIVVVVFVSVSFLPFVFPNTFPSLSFCGVCVASKYILLNHISKKMNKKQILNYRSILTIT